MWRHAWYDGQRALYWEGRMRVWALVGTPGAGGVLKAHPGDVNPFVIWLWSLLIRFVVGVFLLTRPQLPRTHTRPHTRARTDTHTVDGCLSWPASTQTPPPFCSPVPPESLSLWEALEVIPGRGPPLYPLCGPLIHSLTTAWEKTMSFIIPFFSLFLFLAFSLSCSFSVYLSSPLTCLWLFWICVCECEIGFHFASLKADLSTTVFTNPSIIPNFVSLQQDFHPNDTTVFSETTTLTIGRKG